MHVSRHRYTAPLPNPGVTIRPIHVDTVEVVLEGGPSVRVRGVVGDGCTKVSSVQQERGGATVDIRILSERPTDAICTQIAQIYDETLRLPGAYPSGAYVVRVNGVERTFTVP